MVFAFLLQAHIDEKEILFAPKIPLLFTQGILAATLSACVRAGWQTPPRSLPLPATRARRLYSNFVGIGISQHNCSTTSLRGGSRVHALKHQIEFAPSKRPRVWPCTATNFDVIVTIWVRPLCCSCAGPQVWRNCEGIRSCSTHTPRTTPATQLT